jgi:hypothetical protein
MIFMLETIGKVNPEIVISYLETLHSHLISSKSSYAIDRNEIWFRHSWVGGSLFSAPEDERISALGDSRRDRFANRLLPNWQIAAVFFGKGIKPHRDHSLFGKNVVSVNLAEAQYQVNDFSLLARPGQIIKFNSKHLHSVVCDSFRWSICFWDLPPQAKYNQLSLF